MTTPQFPIFLDEPAEIDLLSFDAVAETMVEALLDTRLTSVALGVSGDWGSGKTTVLRLIQKELESSAGDPPTRLVIRTDPWRYDPQMGAKESLIGEILTALEAAIPDDGTGEKAKRLLTRMLKRVNWGKALQVAARSAITVSLPSLDSLEGLIKPKEEEEDPAPITDMVVFRDEFQRLIECDGLSHLTNIVVLVDDLDRCLSTTVIDTLETMRLFLSAPKMSFVIAADENRVADAIAERFPDSDTALDEERPSRLYLHKIVQTSVPVPALSDFDTEAYLVLLQAALQAEPEVYGRIVSAVADARRRGNALDSVEALNEVEIGDARASAARIKPIIHEKTKGNPRRVKRFMNDLSVRLGIASRRGIVLDAPTIAKLMILETYFAEDFKALTDWLRTSVLKERLSALEAQVGAGPTTAPQASTTAAAEPGSGEGASSGRRALVPQAEATAGRPSFSDGLLRWARLTPSLVEKDIAPYLVFAASFQNISLVDEGLPERLRDISANLLSPSIAQARSITDSMIQSLTDDDASRLIRVIGGVAADQPDRQASGVVALIRFARLRPTAVPAIVREISRIRPEDLRPGALLSLRPSDPQPLWNQFEALAKQSGREGLMESLHVAREG